MQAKCLAIVLFGLLLSACQTSESEISPTPSSEGGGFALRGLPDPASWGYTKLYNYYYWQSKKGYVHWRDHTLVGRATKKCGMVMQHIGNKGTFSTRIYFYEQLKKKTPERAQCWSDTAQSATERRIQEVIYLKALYDNLKGIRGPKGQEAFGKEGSFTDDVWKNYSFAKELDKFEKEMNKFRSVNAWIDAAIRNEKRRRKKELDSWGRAAAVAVSNFSQSNAFTRPPPGSSVVSSTSDLFPNASPAVKMSLENLDRNVMGEQAYSRRLAQQAEAAARATEYRSSSTSSGSGLTLKRVCSYGQNADGSCVSFAQKKAEEQARVDESQRQIEAENVAARRKIARMAEAAKQREAAGRQQLARNCGYNTWEEYKQKARVSCQ